MSALLRRNVDLTVNREGVLGRRDLLKLFAASGIAGTARGWRDGLNLQAAEMRRRNRACILLWMDGGPSQFETFDPKPGHANGGETAAIATNVPGIRIAENLPKLSKLTDRMAIIRTLNTREGQHHLATYTMQTSRLPVANLKLPSLGAVAAHDLAEAACELPAFVRIGERWLAGGTGGYLGSQYDAYVIPQAGRLPDNVQSATDAPRFRRRLDLTAQLQESSVVAAIAQSKDHRRLYDHAARMILSPQMKAFDLEQEPAEARDAYGRTQFGAACLLSRRLVESGVTFVEVGLSGWDTHENNFVRSKQLCGQFDQPFAYLLTDLAQRGLLDQTLVVWLGEFGRTPKINPRAGRDHFPPAFSAVLAGGGVRGGQVIGATDVGGENIQDRPVTVPDLFQSIYKSLQIDTRKEYITPIGRPIKFVDGGAAVEELFS